MHRELTLSQGERQVIIQCPSCQTKFAIESTVISEVDEPRFHCSRCDNLFSMSPENEYIPLAVPANPPASAEVTAKVDAQVIAAAPADRPRTTIPAQMHPPQPTQSSQSQPSQSQSNQLHPSQSLPSQSQPRPLAPRSLQIPRTFTGPITTSAPHEHSTQQAEPAPSSSRPTADLSRIAAIVRRPTIGSFSLADSTPAPENQKPPAPTSAPVASNKSTNTEAKSPEPSRSETIDYLLEAKNDEGSQAANDRVANSSEQYGYGVSIGGAVPSSSGASAGIGRGAVERAAADEVAPDSAAVLPASAVKEASFFGNVSAAEQRAMSARVYTPPVDGWRGMMVLVAPLALTVVVLMVLSYLATQRPLAAERLVRGMSIAEVPPSGVIIKNTKFAALTLDSGEKIHTISGKIVNQSSANLRDVRLEGLAFDHNGNLINSTRVSSASTLIKTRIKSLPVDMIRNMQSVKNARRGDLAAGQEQDFLLALLDSPGADDEIQNARYFSARVYSVR